MSKATMTYTPEEIYCCNIPMCLDNKASKRCQHCGMCYLRVFVCSRCGAEEQLLTTSAKMLDKQTVST